jgi:tripartite ATP-independent transporter DctM subunit
MDGLIATFVIFFILLAIGAPVFVGILLGATVGLYIQIGFGGTWGYLADSLYYIMTSYVFATIVMFILIGQLSDSGGLGTRAYQAFYKLVGHLRGGVFTSTIFAAAAFGACSGSSVASAALFARIALPEMKKFSYSESVSLGCVATAGTLAILIPPSGMMVIYGVLTNVSIGRLLIGGIIPGIVLAILLAAQVFLQVTLKPSIAPTNPNRAPIREQVISMLNIWPLALVFAIVVASIWSGLVTPSEAGALGVGVVLIWNFIARIKLRNIFGAFHNAVVTSCQIMILVVGGLILSKVVAYSNVSTMIIDWIVANNVPLPGIWAILIVAWLILGMFVDSTSQLVLTLPLFFPIMTKLGVDPIALGVVAIVMIEVGVITPPVGFNCYVVSSIAGVDPGVAFKGIFPFFVTLLIAVAILILFPILATLLPSLAFG